MSWQKRKPKKRACGLRAGDGSNSALSNETFSAEHKRERGDRERDRLAVSYSFAFYTDDLTLYTNTKQRSNVFLPRQDSTNYIMGVGVAGGGGGEEVGVGKGAGWGRTAVGQGALGPAADELQTSCQNFFFFFFSCCCCCRCCGCLCCCLCFECG